MKLRKHLERRARVLGGRALEVFQRHLPERAEQALDDLHGRYHDRLPSRLAAALDVLRGDQVEPWQHDQTFQFRCHLGVSCLNVCCTDTRIVLTPYDVLRLSQTLGCSGSELLDRHARVQVLEETGLPLVWLRMSEAADRRCSFAGEQGCEVYPGRPGVCRGFPVGRTSFLDELGEHKVQLVLQRDSRCRGFAEQGSWTPQSYFADQKLDDYLDFADRYTSLISRVRAAGVVLGPKQQELWLMALYRLDRFRARIDAHKLLIRHRLPTARRREIRTDDEACLVFAFDWVESVVLAGDSGGFGAWGI